MYPAHGFLSCGLFKFYYMKVRRFKCLCGCGNNVKPNYIRERVPSTILKNWDKAGKITGVEGYGYLNNGYFNTLRCAFDWATRRLKDPARFCG